MNLKPLLENPNHISVKNEFTVQKGESNKITHCFLMKGKIWNGRGLKDLAKHIHVADCIKEHNFDFVAISESDKRDFPMHTLNHLSGGIEFIWKWIPPRGRSEGILIGVRASCFEVFDYSFGEFHIKLHLR